MSKKLSGYTTIDKSLSGIITISDGAGTTISEGVITTNTINVTDLNATNIIGNVVANNITSTATATDGTKYRFVLTSNSSTNPKSLLTDGTLLYTASTNVLEAVALRVFSSLNNTAITQTNYYPLYFGLGSVANGGNYVYQSSSVTYRPSTDVFTANNIYFTTLNGIAGVTFSTNMTNTQNMYDALGGNSTSGLPTFSSPYNQIIWPTNQRTYGGYVVDGGSYFGGASNIFGKYRFENDPDFNTKNFFQIALAGPGTTYTGTTNVGVCGIDFTTWDYRSAAASRIYARDNASYSADLLFATAPSYSTSIPQERMRIMADGNVGIGTSAPSELLEVAGIAKITGLATGNIYAISPTNNSYVFSEKTSGNIRIGDNGSFTGSITLGNTAGLTGIIRLYAGNGYLNGAWTATTQTAGNSSTLIATTEFVSTAISSATTAAVQLTSTSSQNINSTLAVTGRLTTNTPAPYAVLGSGTGAYDQIITNDTGNIVYTFGTGLKTVYASYDGGVTWSAIYTSANVITSVSCTNTGKYVAISVASLASQVSSNYGATFSTLSITGLSTFYPLTYISIMETMSTNGFFFVAFCQCNTSASNRVDFYTTNGGFGAGTFQLCNLAGNTAFPPQIAWSDISVNPSIIYIPIGGLTAYSIAYGTTGAITYLTNGILGSPTSVGNMRQVKTNYAASYSQLIQIATTTGLFQSSNGGSSFTKVISSAVIASGCSRAGNILVYSQTASPFALYISNNQYTTAIGTTPSYTSLYTPSAIIRDVIVSGNGQKIYFSISGVSDRVYQISLQGAFTSYQSDFNVDKERTLIKSKSPSDTLGTFYDVFIPYKVQQINFSVTLTLPFSAYYSLNGTTALTVTLPRITDYIVGIKIEFFNTGVKTTSLTANSNDCIISPSSPIVYTVTSYNLVASATVNSLRLLATYCPNTSAKEFAWIVC